MTEYPIRLIRQEKDLLRVPFALLLNITTDRLRDLEEGKEPINAVEKAAFTSIGVDADQLEQDQLEWVARQTPTFQRP